ncbi:MAG: EAL domain-containing protein [Candidatus Delongbacteria bacterium]|nr:EAL domain-containing protein [Candidatus Cloacimonadota bacterium]MCA9786341.1 EAL domain-containing protein [Candidatus Cloacimonadota bacterium]MCB9472385.1 EAL domain-containing protein [Candidatus Delongbacteria bacterium]
MHSYLARQPILDEHQNLAAYELLYRSSERNLFPVGEEDVATCRVLQSALIQFGLDELSADHRVFINLIEDALLQGSYHMLPQDRVVLELLESVEPSSGVLQASRQLKKDGYTLALDDFTFRSDYLALVQLADVIKVDLRETEHWKNPRAVEALLGRGKQMLAEKVETHEEFQQARELGYTRFQGFFFSRPQMLKARNIKGSALHYTQLLNQISSPELDVGELERIISADISLSWKLLRYINSAAMARRQEIGSIRQALLMLGESQIRRWASVVAVGELNKGHSIELLKLCLIRARFCESISGHLNCNPAEMAEAFLTGLLSGLDAMLDMAMHKILPELHLSPTLNRALLEHTGSLHARLELVQCYESGNVDRVASLSDELGLDAESLPGIYKEAVGWVQQTLAST